MKTVKLAIGLILGSILCMGWAIGQGSDAQKTAVKVNPAVKKPMKRAIYSCQKCEMASYHSGKCPGCGTKMTKINGTSLYACPDCHTTAVKAGKCPKCGKAMAKMVRTYACDACHVTSEKPGKCPKCKKAMAVHFLPFES